MRAIFVHPDSGGRGIARRLVATAEAAAARAGFRRFELLSTLNAEAVYVALGYRALGQVWLELPNGIAFPSIRMVKALDVATLPGVQACGAADAPVPQAA
jgi:GNAT superfamily N-acetyltransferase